MRLPSLLLLALLTTTQATVHSRHESASDESNESEHSHIMENGLSDTKSSFSAEPLEIVRLRNYINVMKRYALYTYYGNNKYSTIPSQQQYGDNKKDRYGQYQDRRPDTNELNPVRIQPAEESHKRDFAPTADQLDPPPATEAARMARYIVHNTDWTSVGTISSVTKIKGYPFVSTLSMSDGPVESGSGVPYLFLTSFDITAQDLAINRRCSLSMTLAETDYCKQQQLDPEDPRCARVTFTGEMLKIRNGTTDAKKAEEALFSRHPIMKQWPKDHQFFFATLKIEEIILLDYFGGPKYIKVEDYFRVNP